MTSTSTSEGTDSFRHRAGRRQRGGDRLRPALGADARIARRGRADARRDPGAAGALRPRAGRRLQARGPHEDRDAAAGRQGHRAAQRRRSVRSWRSPPIIRSRARRCPSSTSTTSPPSPISSKPRPACRENSRAGRTAAANGPNADFVPRPRHDAISLFGLHGLGLLFPEKEADIGHWRGKGRRRRCRRLRRGRQSKERNIMFTMKRLTLAASAAALALMLAACSQEETKPAEPAPAPAAPAEPAPAPAEPAPAPAEPAPAAACSGRTGARPGRSLHRLRRAEPRQALRRRR